MIDCVFGSTVSAGTCTKIVEFLVSTRSEEGSFSLGVDRGNVLCVEPLDGGLAKTTIDACEVGVVLALGETPGKKLMPSVFEQAEKVLVWYVEQVVGNVVVVNDDGWVCNFPINLM